MPFDLAESFIAATERELGAELPASYKAAMALSNGGEVEVAHDAWQLHPIADTSDRKRLARTANHIIRETASLKAWPNFPANAVAIAANGSGDHLVLIHEGGVFSSLVFRWSHETGTIQKVAEDFHELERS